MGLTIYFLPTVQIDRTLSISFRSEIPRSFQRWTRSCTEEMASPGSIDFILLVNKLGQTRLASYYNDRDWKSVELRIQTEGEIIRQCLRRPPDQCQILQYRGFSIVYRRYASLFFIVGCRGSSANELATLEFIHCLVETFDRHFESVCELDVRLPNP